LLEYRLDAPMRLHTQLPPAKIGGARNALAGLGKRRIFRRAPVPSH
jgi:hypothetical protein